MTPGGWIRFLTGLLSLAWAVGHDHQREADTYHVSAGHLFLLSCQIAGVHSEVEWSRGARGGERLPGGVEVRGGTLWFLPVQETHSGSYVCENRNKTKPSKRRFRVLVSGSSCPDPSEEILATEETSEGLQCKQTEVFRLNLPRKIRWTKDCQQVQPDRESVYLSANGLMTLAKVSGADAGKYTCHVDVTVDGWNYTAARSVQLTVKNDTLDLFPEIHVVRPKNEVVIVEVGKRAELHCKAYTGFSEDEEIVMFWTIDGTYASDISGLVESWEFIHERGKVFGQSTLSIAVVRNEFLNIPINCHISSPAEAKVGEVRLQEADPTEHNRFYMIVSLWLSALFTILILTAFFLICKVNLFLAYRALKTLFSKQAPDGKLYDAYVSVGQSAMPSLDGVAHFALRLLPEELEQKHGYSLYIRGRDDRPGEAVHDAVCAAVRQCRRLLIILSSAGKLKENHNQLAYEQKVGLHDALMRNDPKVILVEVDGPVDYSQLPESLRYVKRTQGALEWKNSFAETDKLTQIYLRRNFWKSLRCRMPAAPARRLQSIA
ncbi:interleukin-1 receptor-like 1 [Poeciliopsis prolifica]|uniref:interleukin-1 receptor-like 1 n=1 Tax=Poeciliopsis prolifica TaxID=188132 RepID=UPI002412FE27|nr:interleukin-1 receptor-like 1 [Poeciliopsis prolifica]XP_054887336.1 interleukin-1 receptor-like 1 [Poeciliopsis prolifica]XP_054887337.1 interleukin-1 receptor-like 1 [Poeciliopsis prolifica]